jgi:uncharacterized protein GlcG (DUF336 family)
MSIVNLAVARRLLAAAEIRAAEIGVPMNLAIADEGGNLVAFVRMDDAWLGSIEISQNKAYTARAFNLSTRELATLSQPGKPLFGIANSNGGRIIIFGGGVPLQANGRIVGAIGASGGQPDQDHQVAEAGARALDEALRSEGIEAPAAPVH